MKYLQYGQHGIGPGQSLETSAFPSPAEISEPPKTVLVVYDEPMGRELETQVLCGQGYKGPAAGRVVEAERMVRGLETQVMRMQRYTAPAAECAAEALRLAGETATIHLL